MLTKLTKKSAPKAAPTKKVTDKKATPAKSGPPTDKEIMQNYVVWDSTTVGRMHPRVQSKQLLIASRAAERSFKKVEFKTVDQLRATGNAEDSFAAEAMVLGLGMAAKGEAADAEAGTSPRRREALERLWPGTRAVRRLPWKTLYVKGS